MTTIRHILVPLDFTAESRNALRHARDLARLFRSRIHLLHVIDLPSALPGAPDLQRTLQRMQNTDGSRARFALASIIDEERLDALRTDAVVLTGRPGEVIARYAREAGIDLIIMGLHPEDAFSRLGGHVTDRVMRAVECPVLAVPERYIESRAIRGRLEAELAC